MLNLAKNVKVHSSLHQTRGNIRFGYYDFYKEMKKQYAITVHMHFVGRVVILIS